MRVCSRIVMTLGGVLPIQGPPGAGKTYTGVQMILDLARSGKKVGGTADIHKVIRNLLDATVAEAALSKFDLQCMHKSSEKMDAVPRISFSTDNSEVLAALAGNVQVVSGTAWFWARPDAANSVDVLFVDEAAQMSLANVLAVSQAAKSLVLLGDPQQLEQPTQGQNPIQFNPWTTRGLSCRDVLIERAQMTRSMPASHCAFSWTITPWVFSPLRLRHRRVA